MVIQMIGDSLTVVIHDVRKVVVLMSEIVNKNSCKLENRALIEYIGKKDQDYPFTKAYQGIHFPLTESLVSVEHRDE